MICSKKLKTFRNNIPNTVVARRPKAGVAIYHHLIQLIVKFNQQQLCRRLPHSPTAHSQRLIFVVARRLTDDAAIPYHLLKLIVKLNQQQLCRIFPHSPTAHSQRLLFCRCEEAKGRRGNLLPFATAYN